METLTLTDISTQCFCKTKRFWLHFQPDQARDGNQVKLVFMAKHRSGCLDGVMRLTRSPQLGSSDQGNIRVMLINGVSRFQENSTARRWVQTTGMYGIMKDE